MAVAGTAMSSTIASRFLDTNVLVYLFDQDSPTKAERSREVLAAAGNVISTQVLQEFYSAVTRKLRLPAAAAQEALEALAGSCRTVTVDVPTISAAAKRSDHQKISFWDALIVETALAAGCGVVLSEDLQHERQYEPSLRVENPYGEPRRRRRRARSQG
jgi:predicted nucleic acid-binding protein